MRHFKQFDPSLFTEDILLHVIDNIPPSSATLASMSGVQRTWRYIAQRALYKVVVLDNIHRVVMFTESLVAHIAHLTPSDDHALDHCTRILVLNPPADIGNERLGMFTHTTSTLLPILGGLEHLC